jgi:4-carboxymuconolactone decarboxylase
VVTISALIGKGITDSSLKYHLMTARKNGVTRTEMAEILTHIAFYAGWPNAWAAFRMAKEVYEEDGVQETHGGFFGMGESNVEHDKYFIGHSYLKLVSREGDPLPVYNVTFEPGCRNNWHIHHAKSGGGQVLICIEGEGWYQEEGKEAQSLVPGTVVEIPAGVKHWHGAKKDSWFSHLAFEIPGEETSNEWCEPVTDEVYDKLG